MRNIIYYLSVLLIVFSGCNSSDKEASKEKMSFAFLTDIHLNMNENNCFEGLQHALAKAGEIGVDFIMTGGDNCDIDILKEDSVTAHKLYSRFAMQIKQAPVPVYPAIGNHDRYWAVDEGHQLFNDGLFESYMERKSYYSFNKENWHFIVLNTANSVVDSVQKQWLKKDLNQLKPNTPIIVVVHVPFLTVYYPALKGKYTAADTFHNFKEIWDLFKGHDLRLVLQGHQHLYEEIKVLNTQFITAGAVSASWWGGAYHGTEEGFLKVSIDVNDKISWEYVDYGWKVNKNQDSE
ncbi:MAG: metallophosphoesterase [Carboxylicivirga sp.]|jgi:hypothetical protein|nr:metallophosphoesterase [Carboxylicivirga sp.]